MTLVLLIWMLMLPANDEIIEVKTNVPPSPRVATVRVVADTAETGKSLAKALERLQRVPSAHSQRDRYRIVTLLGGKLSARVPLR